MGSWCDKGNGRLASRRHLPPFFLYKRKQLYSSGTKRKPCSCRILSQWEQLDGEGEHPSVASCKCSCHNVHKHFWTLVQLWWPSLTHKYGVLEQAKSSNIHLPCLLAHTSHILQPLHVGILGGSKRRLLKQYKTSELKWLDVYSVNTIIRMNPSYKTRVLGSLYCGSIGRCCTTKLS